MGRRNIDYLDEQKREEHIRDDEEYKNLEYPIKLKVEEPEEEKGINEQWLVLYWGDVVIPLFNIKTLMRELEKAERLIMKIFLYLRYNKIKLTKEVRKVVSDIAVLLVLVSLSERIQARTLNIIDDYKIFRTLLSLLLHDEILNKIIKSKEYYKEKLISLKNC
jgi:hypothetical protein